MSGTSFGLGGFVGLAFAAFIFDVAVSILRQVYLSSEHSAGTCRSVAAAQARAHSVSRRAPCQKTTAKVIFCQHMKPVLNFLSPTL